MMFIPILGALGVALFFINKKAGAVSVIDPANWTRFDYLFKRYGTLYGVPWTHLKAIAMNESSLGAAKSVAIGLSNPNNVTDSKSSDGKSWGLMQVTITTARGLDPSATEVKLNNPDYSVRLAAQYVSQLRKMFSYSDPRFLEYVIKSYNQGPGNTKNEIKTGKGYANEYWERFKRNLAKVEG